MRSLYQSIWKEAGIHDAIINSTFKIHRNDDLIIGFAEKWCCEANTFVFPWGEATITLEDMIMLGGYSVLGDSVFSTLENREEVKILEELNYVRIELVRSKSRKASHDAVEAKSSTKHFLHFGCLGLSSLKQALLYIEKCSPYCCSSRWWH